MVFLETEMTCDVLISPDQLDWLQEAIHLRLLEDFKTKKATEELGYFVSVTNLNNIGEGEVQEPTGDMLFPVTFTCKTAKPFKDEILIGVVKKIRENGIFLKSEPIGSIFLPDKKMKDYKYFAGDNPMFMHENQSRPLQKDTMVQFKVHGFKWMEADSEFHVLATLKGDDSLGPIWE